MKLTGFLRYVLLPTVALAAGMKLGIKYAQDHYVSKDRKFIEAEIARREKSKNG